MLRFKLSTRFLIKFLLGFLQVISGSQHERSLERSVSLLNKYYDVLAHQLVINFHLRVEAVYVLVTTRNFVKTPMFGSKTNNRESETYTLFGCVFYPPKHCLDRKRNELLTIICHEGVAL